MKEDQEIFIHEIEEIAQVYGLRKAHSKNPKMVSYSFVGTASIRFNVYFTTGTVTVQGGQWSTNTKIFESYKNCSINDFETIVRETIQEYL